eukprot:COSAG02_NODE_38817_length_424_cov_1.033846_1_plen_52_part_10
MLPGAVELKDDARPARGRYNDPPADRSNQWTVAELVHTFRLSSCLHRVRPRA